MITGLGIGLVGFGLILAYAGITGQHVKQELGAVFTGQTTPLRGPGLNQQAAAGTLPPPTNTAPPSGGTNPLPAGAVPGQDTGNILRSVR